MPIKPKFIVTCERAFLAAGSNNLNLINIFTAINATAFPCTWPQFALVVNFDVDQAGEHTLQTVITDPAGTQVAQTQLPVKTSTGNYQVIANFEHLQFAMPGAYRFEVTLDGHPLGQHLLHINPVVTTGQKQNLA